MIVNLPRLFNTNGEPKQAEVTPQPPCDERIHLLSHVLSLLENPGGVS